MHAGVTNVGELLNPASARLMEMAEHELVDMGKVALKMDKSHPLARVNGVRKKHSACKGVCAFQGCPGPRGGLSKRSNLRCTSCGGGVGAYYHMECFFKVHRCVKLCHFKVGGTRSF